MNQLPYDDLNQLTVYIKATYSGNQEQQEKATEILHEMGKDQVRFVDTMLSLIASDGPANGKNEKKKLRLISPNRDNL